MLLREFMMEPDLNSYSCMIIDEAHERSLHTDICLTLIKDLCAARENFKVIISSATMDAEKFSDYSSIYLERGEIWRGNFVGQTFKYKEMLCIFEKFIISLQ